MRILMVSIPIPMNAPTTMAPLRRQIESLRALGAQVEVLELKGIPKLKYFQSLPALYRKVRHVDLIHAHYGYCGWLARSQFSKPVVVSFMGTDILGNPNTQGKIRPFSRLMTKVDRQLAHVVDAVIVKSAEMAEAVKPTPAHIIPNGVDLQAFQPMDKRQAAAALGLPEDKRYVLFPGNPHNARKGFPFAQAVVSCAVEKTIEPIELLVLHGIAPGDVPLYMNACEAMLMTSFIEGSPNVVKEAMACNLPVISVPVGDVPELLEGVTGYTVCSRDTAVMAAALINTLSQNGHMELGGRDVLKQKGLDLESVARKLMAIYANVLS